MSSSRSKPLRFPVSKREFLRSLLAWYDRNKRSLPWRENPDPYRVWVSEIMLQQTQVKTVLPYFDRFLKTFPTLKELAGAEEEEVLSVWSGLGYYSRARNLHRSARTVRDEYQGVFPTDFDDVIRLPGIGRYTAGAILSIAYGQAYPVLDGNIRRVLARYLRLTAEIGQREIDRLWRLLETVVGLPETSRRVADFNQALMELGALVCTPRNPRCETCPLAARCRAKRAGIQESLPVRTRRRRSEVAHYVVAIIRDGPRFLFRQNEAGSALAGMWEYPKVSGQPDSVKLSALEAQLGNPVRLTRTFDPVRHQITFRRLFFHPVEMELDGPAPDGTGWAWAEPRPSGLAVPAYVHKIRRRVFEQADEP